MITPRLRTSVLGLAAALPLAIGCGTGPVHGDAGADGASALDAPVRTDIASESSETSAIDTMSTSDAALPTDATSPPDGTVVPDGSPPSPWDVTVSPPAMPGATTIVLPGTYLSTLNHPLCTGPAYVVMLDNANDYIVRTTEVLTAPVMIYGGRNVRIVGMQIDLHGAPCASAGASGYIPGTIALRVYQVGTTFVEGAYIDVAGRSADCIDPRNLIGNFDALTHGYSESAARGARDVVVQNTVCRGMSGDVNVHGDILQTQGGDELFRHITFENVSTDSNCEGTVIEPREGFPLADTITMRRFDYRMDDRYSPNPTGTGGFYDGGPVQHSARNYQYDQVDIYRTEAPYEMSPAVSGWTGGTAYAVGATAVWGGGNVYGCITAGTSATTGGPTGTGLDIIDGTVHWHYLRPQDPYVIHRPPCNAGGIQCPATPMPNRFASPGTGAASSAWTGMNYVSPHP